MDVCSDDHDEIVYHGTIGCPLCAELQVIEDLEKARAEELNQLAEEYEKQLDDLEERLDEATTALEEATTEADPRRAVRYLQAWRATKELRQIQLERR